MRLPRSATVRIAALVFALQLAGAATTLVTVRQITRSQITAAAEDMARGVRGDLMTAYRAGGTDALRAAVSQRVQRRQPPQTVLILTNAAGRYLAGNIADWPPTADPGSGATTIELFRIDREVPERMRVLTTTLPGGERLLTGHVIESELRFARAMEEAMAVAMAVALVLAGLAGWIAARIIDARVGRTVTTAQAVAAGDLGRRVESDGGDDAFEALGRAVNAMLDRIALLVGELKVATDGLAHDLRSPLTRLRATLERALAAADTEASRTAIVRAMDEGDRLLSMLDTALRITRAEAGLGREAFADTDIAALLHGLAEMFEPLAEDRGMTMSVGAPADLRAPANREMLGQALANIVDNALKYGRGQIALSAAVAGDLIAITVTDRGPGIPHDRRDDALKRFGRLDTARGESGAGLGLSLVAAVAHLHGGTLTLSDAGPGLAVTFTLRRA
ncbi:HAMP domain-containing histidine kinase [Microvirga sp. SRT01]|uniref:histidine kinase n=1 Tax=Sphingomonas longa TaxID=2778730 RepID=A0ABS2D2G5_9SPHN|nr:MULTISPECIES: HAMP domain-containing sensor histidine kinase [Alphaproteobacteria]MBM6575110.1 HAMP domain-containing histidine kinase [Sphingomonas sp. BT552]MBR7708161.1 HAMP domain-containing histidine kinase [Microvirga sp. SRT01]